MRVLILLVAIVLNFGLWALVNRPHGVAPPREAKVHSLSFAPFRDGQSPLIEVYPTPEQIEEDIILLKDRTERIRLYTSLEGMQVVPGLARKHGLKVTLGVWLGTVLPKNEQEVASAIALAREYPDVVDKIIVGNEVLLRGDLKKEELARYIAQVRDAVDQPVGYADVWEFWLRYPEMAQSVDFVTIHLLPYWEDIPVDVAGAEERIVHAYDEIRKAFPDKPIMVGEAGWPTAGRMRGPAQAGVANQMQFFALFDRLAREHHFDYNLIEAFDQTWKARLEGWTGAAWGIFTADRVAKAEPGQPILERPGWPLLAGAASVIALALAVPGLLSAPGLRGTAAAILLAVLVGDGLVLSGRYALAHSFFPRDFAWQSLLTVAQGLFGLALIAAAAGQPPAAGSLPDRVTRGAWGLLAGGALVHALLLIVDGRYRDFPLDSYGAPLLAPLLLLLAPGPRPQLRGWPLALGAAAALLAVGLVWREGAANVEALGFAALLLCLAAGAPLVRARLMAPAGGAA